MATDNNVNIIINGEDKSKSAIQSAQGNLEGFSGVAKKVGIAIAGAFAVKEVYNFGKGLVQAYADAEASQSRFETSLKNIAHASNLQVEALRKQQAELQRTTRFEDDAIASAQGFLATFALSANQIQTLTPKLLDMAEGLRTVEGGTIGLEQASNMLGKAIQLGTVDALRRVGITVPGTTKAMQDLWQANFENASIQERVAMLSGLVDSNFKNQAVTAGTTLAGKIDQLNNAFGDIKETMGGTLAEALLPMIAEMQKMASDPQFMAFLNSMAQVVGTTLTIAFLGVKTTIELLTASFSGLFLIGFKVYDFFANIFDHFLRGFRATVSDIAGVIDALANSLQRVINLASQVGSKVSSGIKTVTSAVSSTISGKRASGGPVMGGSSYLVGELGPEVFTPSSSGRITANSALAGAGTINITITGNSLLSETAGEMIVKQLTKALKQDIRI